MHIAVFYGYPIAVFLRHQIQICHVSERRLYGSITDIDQ